MTEEEDIKELTDEIGEYAELYAKDIEGTKPLPRVLGISEERCNILQKITYDLCRHAPTNADVLKAIATCGNFNDVEKAFCVYQWTKEQIAHKQKEALSGFSKLFRR